MNIRYNEAKQLLERAAGKPYEGNEALWADVMNLVSLPLSYLIGAQKALSQHRWRNLPNPISYVKTVAKREGFHSGINIPDDYSAQRRDRSKQRELRLAKAKEAALARCTEHPEYDGTGERPWYHCGKCDDIFDAQCELEDATAKRRLTQSVEIVPVSQVADDEIGGDTVSEMLEFASWDAEETEERVPYEYELIEAGLLNPFAGNIVDCERVVAQAGLDKGEAQILRYRFQGYSRDRLIATCKTDAQRRRIVSDWKRLDRKMETHVHPVFHQAAGITAPQATVPSGKRSKADSFLPPWDAIKAARERDTHRRPNRTYADAREEWSKSHFKCWLRMQT